MILQNLQGEALCNITFLQNMKMSVFNGPTWDRNHLLFKAGQGKLMCGLSCLLHGYCIVSLDPSMPWDSEAVSKL